MSFVFDISISSFNKYQNKIWPKVTRFRDTWNVVQTNIIKFYKKDMLCSDN